MKRFRSIFLALMLVAAAGVSARNLAKTFEIKNPGSGLETSCSINTTYVYDHAATKATVKVTAPEEIMPYIEVKSVKGTLTLSIKNDAVVNKYRLTHKTHVTAIVTAPLFKNFEANSGSSLTCTARLVYPKGTKVEMEANSGADLNMAAVECAKFEAETSSGADAKFGEIKAANVSLEVNSGSDMKAMGIVADNLKAKADSGASMTIKGTARVAKLDADSGGSINARQFSATELKASRDSGGSIKTAK